MADHSPKDVKNIERQAQESDRNAEKAKKVLKDALDDMSPQQQHNTEKANNNEEH